MDNFLNPNIEYYNLSSDSDKIVFSKNNTDYIADFHISPFRPEMFGSLIYVVLFYLCHKYNIKLVMHGEANMLPFYSLYSDECIIHNLNKFYIFHNNKLDLNKEIWSEHIQRYTNQILDHNTVRFCNRYSVTPHTHKGSVFGALLDLISVNHGIQKKDILYGLTYPNIFQFYIDQISNKTLFLHKLSRQCLDKIKINNNQIWFCSHNKTNFKTFEEYVYKNIPENVIADSLWSRNQNIQKLIFNIDANCLLSCQILCSLLYNTRFIGSGGVCTLFQTIPFIDSLHLSIWDYYVLEMDHIKSYILKLKNKHHRLFHIGGVLPYSVPIPFGNKCVQPEYIKVPEGAPTLDKYTDNIVTYNYPMSEYLLKSKEKELNFIASIIKI